MERARNTLKATYTTFLPPRKPAQFCNSLVAHYWESKSTNGTVDFWEARVREQAWECRAQSLSHSCSPVSCLHLTQQNTWESHTPQTQVFTEENPKKWEMHYRAACVTRVSLILLCTVWLPEAACRLPSLWVWFPLPMGLCWPSCKSLGSAVFPTLLRSRCYIYLHLKCSLLHSRHQRPQLPTPLLVLSTSSIICFHKRSIQMRHDLQWTLYDCSTFQ